MSIKVQRLLDSIQLQPHYLWSAAHDVDGREMLENYAKHGAIVDAVAMDLAALRELSAEGLYRQLLREVYAKLTNFQEPALWALYWALVEAVRDTMRLYPQKTLEPELNGTLIANIRSAVAHSRPPRRAGQKGLKDLVCLALSHQSAQGMESLSGADFGMILEVRRNEKTSLFAVLIQAKRAARRKVDVRRKAGDSNQLARLNDGGIGAYLFYNEFGPKGPLPITIKSAELVSKEKAWAVDSIALADEFAGWMAFGMSTAGVVGPQRVEDRQEALRRIFNPDRGKDRVNNLLVAVLNEDRLTPGEIRVLEREWDELVSTARQEMAEGRRPFASRPSPGTSAD
jgi:hypothetical protein